MVSGWWLGGGLVFAFLSVFISIAAVGVNLTMLQTLRHLLSLIRFSHTVFALPFALLSAVMAWWLRTVGANPGLVADPKWSRRYVVIGNNAIPFPFGSYRYIPPDGWEPTTMNDRIGGLFDSLRWQELIGILLCMIFARSAAMAFNRLVDRKIDAANPRTEGRHLPAGVLSVGAVWLFAAASAIGFAGSTLLFWPNRLPLYLSLPVLLFLCGYSYAKRFTSLAHFWLGAALAMSPVAAWIAIRGEAVLQDPSDLLPAVVLGGAVLSWVAGFDIIYSCQDYEFDREAKLHSVPAWVGVPAALRIAAASHAATVVLLATLPLVYPLGWIYGLGVAAVALLLAYEHWLVKPNDLGRVNMAFFHVNAVISLGLLAVTIADLLL